MTERDIVAAILRLLKKTPGCFVWKERDHDTKNQERKRTSLQGHFGGGGRRHTQGIGGRAL